jgi:hypothetical protein
MWIIFPVYRKVLHATLDIKSSCLIPSSESLVYILSFPKYTAKKRYVCTLLKCYDKNCLHRHRHERTLLSQWTSGDWQDIQETNLANHSDAEWLLCSERSGAKSLSCTVLPHSGRDRKLSRANLIWIFLLLCTFWNRSTILCLNIIFYTERRNFILYKRFSLRKISHKSTTVRPNTVINMHTEWGKCCSQLLPGKCCRLNILIIKHFSNWVMSAM